MANRRLRGIDHSNQAKLPSIMRKSTTSYSPVDTEDKDITLHFPTFQRCETNHPRRIKAPLSFPAVKKLNQYFCLAFDNELPPIPQIGKKSGISFKKVSGDQERKSNDKLDNKQMHGSLHRQEKEATTSTMSQKTPRNSIHLLQRRVNPGRMYQQNNDRISYEELLAFDQNIDQLHAFTERDVKWSNMKDFSGKVIDPKTTGNGDITLYVERFEEDVKKRNSVDHDRRLSLKKETKLRVQGRFYEALDLHFYHCYRNTHPERRMAICEEIERKIVIDDVTLTRFREHLSLEEILNTWVV